MQHGISVVPGDEKNKNKNPVAERAVQEIEAELLRVQPERGPVSKLTLSIATANANSRVRHDGLSARELWTQRDQVTGSQLPFNDDALKRNQFAFRQRNHNFSATSKAKGKGPNSPSIAVGDLVYLVSERSKTQARDKYLVTSISREYCTVRKFTRHQFRRKEYSVPLTGIYPIVGGIPAPSHAQDPKSSDSSDSDDALDDVVHSSEPTSEVEEVGEEGEVVVEGEQHAGDRVDRPRRDRRAPAWQKDYLMDDEMNG